MNKVAFSATANKFEEGFRIIFPNEIINKMNLKEGDEISVNILDND